MTNTLNIIQFQSPWQGRLGFKRYAFDPASSVLSPSKAIRCEKLMRKAARKVDGLLLRPSWPTRHALCLIHDADDTRLFKVVGHQVDRTGPSLSIDDPDFTMDVAERILYRRFTFRSGDVSFTYRDMAGRLMGPQRVATQIFPDDDFSPFARLVGMLRDDRCRDKLLSDLDRRRFKYSRWIDRDAGRVTGAVQRPA